MVNIGGRVGLIGSTGFVGSILSRHIPFDASYNSRTIDTIRGEQFDVLICAGAPATMWAANQDPEGDRANLMRLASAIDSATVGRLVLVSTIAVFDELSTGYTESNAQYEAAKPYGRNRRELELHALSHLEGHVLRLPALFGPGLKKNFVYDIMNPVPSFVRFDRFAALLEELPADATTVLERVYVRDESLGMMRLSRDLLVASGQGEQLEQALVKIGFTAPTFTNSDSQFQYYNVENLAHDIETSLASDLRVVNICSEPWGAGELYAALTGHAFDNNLPAKVTEDVRTDHAAMFGRSGPYLYDREEVLGDLRALVADKDVR